MLFVEKLQKRGMCKRNIHRAPGKQEVSPYIALGEEDKAALRTLKEKYNITFNTKSTPTGADTASNVDLTKYL